MKTPIIARQPQSSTFGKKEWDFIEQGNLEKASDAPVAPLEFKTNKANMKKKTFYISDELNNALIKYLAYHKINGNCISWQSLIEDFLNKELKSFK